MIGPNTSRPDAAPAEYASPADFLSRAEPDRPVACLRPALAARAARAVAAAFTATPFYAVKANPNRVLLEHIAGAGVTSFDTASLDEIARVRALPVAAEAAYLNPVKSRASIASAYHEHGVRTFVLDHEGELAKIKDVLADARDLDLIVRLSVSNDGAALPLAGKFGATVFDAPALLRDARARARRLGVSFHVGSQCMQPSAYERALAETSALVERAAVGVEIVNVGGGFPALYPGMNPPPLADYVAAVDAGLAAAANLAGAETWCEPGRLIVADAESILVRVELRKADALYLNDGAYGYLFDAAHWRWRFPARVIRPGGAAADETTPMRLFGPTCDAGDAMPGPFHIAADVREGDWIEFGMLGAYGRTMRTPFNGFGVYDEICLRDDPWPSYFDADYAPVLDAVGPPTRRRGRGVAEALGRRG